MTKRNTKAEDTPAADEATQADAPAPGNDEVQSKADVETEQGFRGVEVDPTPNEAYTVSGVVSGAPTPETDPTAANEAQSWGRLAPGDGPGPR